MEKHKINYGGKTIEFELHRKNVKNINLNIKPDMTIAISAKKEVPLDYIQRFVEGKAPWILKNVSYFKNVQPEYVTGKDYVSGETFKYLGKQYRLKVEETEDEEIVKYYQGFIYIYVNDKKDYKRKEKLLNNWFRRKAETNFNDSLNRVYPVIEKYGVKKPEIQIRTMKARWGSCLKGKNTILLNFELIKAPKFCIEYVVLHELIHFKYRNHDAKFYDFITSLMPDWKQRKEILDEEVVREL
ncbi:SprT family zinc-dependent metalloprotease [Herbivorax sp. ANBcel31]|uniref:M48 family metallopeptidase n=1 Tax=Herbivorax sp. ANBcel31 TaxID=3069754 RepID=UPI0027B6B0CE|nr:SprT family zinc-dependent metalloprotease [Herbivorax sp. ANBcel31]MDQ2086069.1 SprT family zinc-dependent metalloprotease [Herbivorax sp. ANBcel31]